MRGAWIEILEVLAQFLANASRSPCGERGLKYRGEEVCAGQYSRSPCGERGLKYEYYAFPSGRGWSLPMRGAWIEMVYIRRSGSQARVAPHAGSVD